MKVLAVSNPKGGSGKTTVLFNLACFFAAWDYRVMILDADSQSSAVDWAAARPKALPHISTLATDPSELLARIRNARRDADPHTLVLLDLPAAFPVAQELALYPHCDGVLIPTLASPVDVRAMVRHLFELYRSGFDAEGAPATGVIINRAKPHTRLHKAVLADVLGRIRFPLVGELRETQNYPLAAHQGRGLLELPPRTVIKDLVQWRPVLDWVAGRLYPEDRLCVETLWRQASSSIALTHSGGPEDRPS